MGSDRRFAWALAWRTALLVGLAVLLGLSLERAGSGATRLLLALAVVAAASAIWAHVRRTDQAVMRFVEAIRYDDRAQRFARADGGGFGALGRALDDALARLAQRQSTGAEENRFLTAVIDDAPVPLLTIDDAEAVVLLNKAARRLFVRHEGVRLPDFAVYGAEFVQALRLPPARRRLSRVTLDGVPQRVIVGSERLERLSGGLAIVSVLPAQQLLGSVELAAQGDLVRVLTHEIMNSLTPVTSLARSAASLLDDTDGDARLAIETLARRAEGLSRFVNSYRDFAAAPAIRPRRFEAAPWLREIVRLCEADPKVERVALHQAVEDGLAIDGDPDLLAQLLINLIRNAAFAGRAHRDDPEVWLTAARTQSGRVTLLVADNGPGIPAAIGDDVFLPFYTTRPDGSGVGLSFARQVAVAHGGVIAVEEAPGGGALFRILI